MKNMKMYEPQDKMIMLIKDNYSVLQALSCFGINLGFGDLTVEETCQTNGVDTYTFLAVGALWFLWYCWSIIQKGKQQ